MSWTAIDIVGAVAVLAYFVALEGFARWVGERTRRRELARLWAEHNEQRSGR